MRKSEGGKQGKVERARLRDSWQVWEKKDFAVVCPVLGLPCKVMFNFLSLWRSRLVAAWIVCPLCTPCDRNEVLCRCSVLVQYLEDVSLIYTPPGL